MLKYRITRKFILIAVLVTGFLALNGCDVTDDKHPEGPVADFSWSDENLGPSVLAFHNLSANADRFVWCFPGGLSSTVSDPVFGFSGSGIQSVTLIAFESASSRVDSLTRTITIMPSRFLLDSVIVEQIPFKSPMGEGWDGLTGPDLYYLLYKHSGMYEAGSFLYPFEDLRQEQLPVGWKYTYNGYFLSDWDYDYRIDVLDKDNNNSDRTYQTLIGSVSFRVRDLIENHGFNRSFTFNDDSLRVRIVVKWE